MADPYHAFCNDPPIRIEGARHGPLAGATFAVKDLFNFAGHVTGAGNPDWARTHPPAQSNAEIVQNCDAGASALGKTHTDELSKGIFGDNGITERRSIRARQDGFLEAHRADRRWQLPASLQILRSAPTPADLFACRPAFVGSMASAPAMDGYR